MTNINKSLDGYFQWRGISTKTKIGVQVMQKILDIEISRSMHIPYAPSINELEVQDYRFLSLFFQKERFWKNKNQNT